LAIPEAQAMPFDTFVSNETASGIQTVAYRHRAHRRVYRRHYGYNPGPAMFGAMAGIIGAGIAASQQPTYYYYGAPGYYPYGYGYPYGDAW
jgi:hypothetical protein